VSRNLKICALSTLTGASATRQATRVEPITFPPHTIQDFKPGMIEGADLLYVHLHGIDHQPYWYGDGFQTAVSVEQIKACYLPDVIAFVANCFGQDSRMVEALFIAGAQTVVAGPGTNYTVVNRLRGADLLGANFIKQLAQGRSPAEALASAKRRLRLLAFFSPIERDALGFTLQTIGV
jgi:hypothetical protein